MSSLPELVNAGGVPSHPCPWCRGETRNARETELCKEHLRALVARERAAAKLSVVCAWCQAKISGPDHVPGAPVSHGICMPCLAKQKEELKRENPGDESLQRLVRQARASGTREDLLAAAQAAVRARQPDVIYGVLMDVALTESSGCDRRTVGDLSNAYWHARGAFECDGKTWTPKENPDERMRDLERQAKLGDPQAAAAFRRAKQRVGIKRPKKLTVPEAEEVVVSWLQGQGWAPDRRSTLIGQRGRGRGGRQNQVWISPDQSQRMTFLRRNVRFERGGRGRWEKNFKIHQWGSELLTTDFAKQLQAAEQQAAPPMPSTESGHTQYDLQGPFATPGTPARVTYFSGSALFATGWHLVSREGTWSVQAWPTPEVARDTARGVAEIREDGSLVAKNPGVSVADRALWDAEVATGTQVELEHTRSRKQAQKIALDHLREDPHYYAKLRAVGMNPASSEAQAFVSQEISHLVRDKVYPQKQAVAAALSIARKKGYRVAKKKNPDEDLRRLEREAAMGDVSAKAKLEAYRLRHGLPVEERRKYVADLVVEALSVPRPAAAPGFALPTRASRRQVAQAIRVVLKAEKFKNLSVTTPDYAWANTVEIRGSGRVTPADYVRLLTLFYGTLDSRLERRRCRPPPRLDAPWAVPPYSVDRLSLSVWNREDQSQPMADVFSPQGPSLPWWLHDTFKAALVKAVSGAKPKDTCPGCEKVRELVDLPEGGKMCRTCALPGKHAVRARATYTLSCGHTIRRGGRAYDITDATGTHPVCRACALRFRRAPDVTPPPQENPDDSLRALERAAASGDPQAREALQRHLQRVGLPTDQDRRQAAVAQILDYLTEIRAHLEDALAYANGRRRTRTVSWDELRGMILQASISDPRGGFVDHCEPVTNAYKYRAYTTNVLIVRDGDYLSVGAIEGPAKACTPGRAWHNLQPWRPNTAAGLRKRIEWARSPGHVVIPLPVPEGRERQLCDVVLPLIPPTQENPDEELRRLERAASTGEPAAQVRLEAYRRRITTTDEDLIRDMEQRGEVVLLSLSTHASAYNVAQLLGYPYMTDMGGRTDPIAWSNRALLAEQVTHPLFPNTAFGRGAAHANREGPGIRIGLQYDRPHADPQARPVRWVVLPESGAVLRMPAAPEPDYRHYYPWNLDSHGLGSATRWGAQHERTGEFKAVRKTRDSGGDLNRARDLARRLNQELSDDDVIYAFLNGMTANGRKLTSASGFVSFDVGHAPALPEYRVRAWSGAREPRRARDPDWAPVRPSTRRPGETLRLDGNWMGGNGIASWVTVGVTPLVQERDLGSKAAQSVQRRLRRMMRAIPLQAPPRTGIPLQAPPRTGNPPMLVMGMGSMAAAGLLNPPGGDLYEQAMGSPDGRKPVRKPARASRKGNRASRKGPGEQGPSGPAPKYKKKRITLEEAANYPGFEDAVKAYRDFHQREPKHADAYTYDDGQQEHTYKVVVGLGEVPETHYVTPWPSNKKGYHWIHHHPKGHQPLEVLDPVTGTTSKIGGTYRVANGWWRK